MTSSSSTNPSDIEEWLDKVDAVHAAVQGIVKGDIKPVDTTPLLEKLESESAEVRAKREADERAAEQTRLERDGRKGKGTSMDYIEFCTGCHTEYIIPVTSHTCIHCKSNLITREERHAQLQSKVDALHTAKQARRERRARFDAYRKQQEKRGGTNYEGWDIWEPPSDDESDDAPVSAQDPRFAALEQDIRTREAKRAADAHECEQYKQLGNTAFKQGSYDTAIAYYNQAINVKKDEKSVYTNRALCHIHQQSWSFAIKDCNTVMDIWQYLENHKFYNREQHSIICKALLRRAMAYHGLKNYDQALSDIKHLCDIYTQHEYHTSIDPSILKLKSKIESDREEAERTQHVMKDVTTWEEKEQEQMEKIVVIDDEEKHETKQQTSTRSDADEIVYQLREIERLSHETSLSSLSSHLTILQRLVSPSHPSHTSHSIIFRESHGISICLTLFKHTDITSHISSLLTICYDICVENDKNREMMGKEGGIEVLLNVLERSDAKFRFATLKLLVLLSEHESIRILLSPSPIQSRLFTCLTSYLNAISSSSSSTLSNIQIAAFGTSLLCNCAYQISWKKYLRDTNILTLLISTLEIHGVMAFHITSPSIHHIDLISRILAALANMMTDTILRQNLINNTTHLTTLSSLLTLAMIMCQSKKYIIDSDSSEAIDKLLIVWLNLSVDDIPCQHLFTSTSSLFIQLITLIQTTSLSYPLREHALGLLCRGLKHLSSSHDTVINNHGIGMMLHVLHESIEKKEEKKNGFTEMAYEYAIRGVTLLTGSSSSAITHVTSFTSSHTSGIDILVSLLSSSNDQIAGNACLCLAHVLKDTKNVPKAKGAIVPLITLMRSSSRRSCHNNAAICCARLAAHPDHLPIIREMQGMQLMMQITQQQRAK